MSDLFLAEVSEARPALETGECLSVFFAAGASPSDCLQDPAVIGGQPAPGHWRLLGVDDDRRRAYYARIGHVGASVCAGQTARA